MAKQKPTARWDKAYTDGTKFLGINEVFIQQLLARFTAHTSKEPTRVIDLGCGDGSTLASFGQIGVPLIGIDFSSVGLDLAKDNLKSYSDQTTLISRDLNDIKEIDLGVSDYSLWVCKLVLAFVEDKQEFLSEVAKKMSSHDVLLLMTPILHDGINYSPEDKPNIAIKETELAHLLSDNFAWREIFSDAYRDQRVHTVSYLLGKQ